MARREDDKCASYGSLFIGQSSGDRSRRSKRAVRPREIRREIRFGVWTLWGRAEKPGTLERENQETGKGATGAAKFTPRGTTYVFVNVVVAPRYVARVQLGSGGL